MTMCPNSKHACLCQPQEGVMCPYGPTPKDWPGVAENIDAERAAPVLPRDYLAWWTSIETDLRKSMLFLAHREPARLHALVRQAYEAGQKSVEAVCCTPSASIGEDGLPELPEGDEAGMFSGPCIVYTANQMRQYAREAVAADRWAREVTVTNYGNPVDKVNQAPQAAQGVKTWQERYNEMGAGPSLNDKSVAMLSEIADLRAQLARQSQDEPVAWCVPGSNGKPWFGKGWMFGPVKVAQATMPLYAAPPLSSEQQAGEGESDG